MDRVAPTRYRLEQPAHCLGPRSERYRTAPARRPGQRKATSLASARRLELGGSPRRLVGANLNAANAGIRPRPAPYFPGGMRAILTAVRFNPRARLSCTPIN